MKWGNRKEYLTVLFDSVVSITSSTCMLNDIVKDIRHET